jgi:cytochrome c peroxidase
MSTALRRRPVQLALLAALVVAAGAVVWLLARGGEPPRDPHALRLSAKESAPVLRAAEAEAASRSQTELVADGRRLFRNPDIANSGESCQTCHAEGSTNPSLGTIPKSFGPRDAPVLWGVAETAPYGWAGDVPTLEQMALNTVVGHFKESERDTEEKRARAVAALVAYLKSLKPPTTAFDLGTMSAAAKRGEELFQGKGGCIGCHTGPLFTDNSLNQIERVPDSDIGNPQQPGAFNTPTLRDVANTAPYMHDGRLKTLTDVVQFYDNDSTIAPLDLTDQEVSDIVAYLEALSR